MKTYYIQALEMLIYLLEKDGSYEQWVEWLKTDIKYFEECSDVDHHIQAYGGMGSFNDLYLPNLNHEEKMMFDIMKVFCYQFTFFYKRIDEDIYILEKDVLNEVLHENRERREALFIFILDGLQSGNILEFYLSGKQYKNIKDIVFSRSSVCMADDMNENTRTYACHVNLPYQSILTIVKEYHFLPHISGNDVVWVAINSKGKEILSYFTKDDKLCLIANKKSIEDVCDGVYKIFFKYYCSRELRGKYLFEEYQGDTYQMWRDGVIDEYQLCSITKKQEEEWRKQL